MNIVIKDVKVNIDDINEYIGGFDNIHNTGPEYIKKFLHSERHNCAQHKFYIFLKQCFEKNKTLFLNNSPAVAKYLKMLSFVKKNVNDFDIKDKNFKTRLTGYIAEADNLIKVLNSIVKQGFIYNPNDPVMFLKIKNNYMLIDGFNRFFACKYLQIKNIDAQVIEYEM